MNEQIILLIDAIAWPMVALIAIVVAWKTDAIGKLTRISTSIEEFKSKLSDLIDSEEKLRASAGSIGEVTSALVGIQNDFVQLKADVENIRDRVDQPSDHSQQASSSTADLSRLFQNMEQSWKSVNNRLEEIFGWFDKRSIAGEVYRFAHGNRKTTRLEYEDADEIARLHSSIKSYRRRQSSLSEWLNKEVSEDFVAACNKVLKDLKRFEA